LCLIPCSAASGSGGWLLKTVKTMVNASSRLCAFVRWCFFFLSLRLLSCVRLLYSIFIGKRRYHVLRRFCRIGMEEMNSKMLMAICILVLEVFERFVIKPLGKL
jgi:hypothetical protein